MSYTVLARKYRPQRFSDVIGQDHVTRTLKNALEQQRIAHGYIFSGHRGIGKTTIARILAMALNCRSAAHPVPEPCGVCDSCREIREGSVGAMDVIEIDAAKPAVTRRVSLAPSESPSGLAIDVKNKKLFSVCDNKMMAVTDIATMKVIATPAIGTGPDAAGFDPGTGLAFSSNGDGTLTIVKLVNGKYEAADTVTTERGARTMTVDPKLHRVYLLAAEYGPAPEAKEGKKGRAPVLPDSFHVLVVGK